MPKQAPKKTAARKLRTDAQLNRERILDAARDAFTQHGPEATLDDIARRAKVGPGTLYRHFPTRDALIEAVFRSQVDKLTAAADHYTLSMDPVEALRAWMFKFIDYVVGKLVILPALDSVPGGSTRLIEGTRSVIHGTFQSMVQRAVDSGDLRPDTNADDLFRAFVGVFHTTSLPGWESSARRIVGILIEASLRRD
ncbi:MAG: TetR/AcrR family transcriptional regulator [Janthinobacterium lividum]